MDALIESILAELRPRIREWYPDADEAADLTVLDVDSRAIASVIRVQVSRVASAPTVLIVKAGRAAPATDTADRPRLVPQTDTADRRQFEFEALQTIGDRLAEVADPRFVAVRPLGVLPGSTSLVMEEFDGRPLHRFLLRPPLRKPAKLEPSSLASAAGRWLRILHDTPASTQKVRQGTTQEIGEAFGAYGSYLAAERGSRHLDPVIRAGIAAVEGLPDPLPTVVTHGDFAPRNILVAPSGRIAVIDLLARWQAPAYEDLAGFLVALETSRVNAATRGILFGRAVGRLEPAFLTGYFGSEPVPRNAIRVYELLLVLDKWSARVSRNRTLAGIGRLRERLIDSHFDARSRLLARRLRDGV